MLKLIQVTISWSFMITYLYKLVILSYCINLLCWHVDHTIVYLVIILLLLLIFGSNCQYSSNGYSIDNGIIITI